MVLKGPQNTYCRSVAGGGGIVVLHIALLFLEVISEKCYVKVHLKQAQKADDSFGIKKIAAR